MLRRFLPRRRRVAAAAARAGCRPPAGLARALALCAGLATASAACSRSTDLDISGRPYAPAAAPGSPFALCPVHDPSIAAEDGVLYLFSTDTPGLPTPPFLHVRTSRDGGATWATGEVPAVLPALPAWAAEYNATSVWAPDVSFNRVTREWHVYYALSSFGSQNSAIGLSTAPTLAGGAWADRGLVLSSARGDAFNAIDPTVAWPPEGGSSDAPTLTFGSFWGGIQSVALDAATGKPAAGAVPVAVASRAAPDAIEGSFLVTRRGAWYLFASFDYCCRGAKSTYNVRVGRGAAASGPFFGRDGTPMLGAGGGTPLVRGGHGWAAGGGESVLAATVLDASPTATLVLHAYDGVSGDPWVQLLNVTWSDSTDGWPVVPGADEQE